VGFSWDVFVTHRERVDQTGENLMQVGRIMKKDEKHNRLVDEFLAPENSVSLVLLVAVGSAIWGTVAHWTTPPQWLSVIIILGIVVSSPWIFTFPRRLWPRLVHTWVAASEEHRKRIAEALFDVGYALCEISIFAASMKVIPLWLRPSFPNMDDTQLAVIAAFIPVVLLIVWRRTRELGLSALKGHLDRLLKDHGG
jgi:hypothetical protein